MSKINDSFAIITEAFQSINISEEGYLELSNTRAFIHLFDDVDDFRQTGKVRYQLSDLLLLIFIAILREKTNSFLTIAVDIEVNKKWYKAHGLLNNDNTPSHDTIRRVMMYVSSDTIKDVLIDKLYSFLETLESEIKGKKYKHLSVDGKEVRGSGRSEETKSPKRNISLLNVYDNDLSTCISSEQIDSKTNEIPVFQSLLTSLKIKNTVFTADALHTQRTTCALIHNGKGYYVLPLKENNKLLLEDAKARFMKHNKKVYTKEEDKRTFEFYNLPKQYAVDGYTGIKKFIRMTSNVRKKPFVMYFISNLKDDEYIIQAIETRWQIENDLHKEKDIYFNEDLIRYTDKNAVQSMAIMNNLGLIMIRLYNAIIKPKSMTHSKLYIKNDPIEAFNTLLGVIESEAIINTVKTEIRQKTK